MTWKVFGGQYHEVFFGLLKERCKQDGCDINDDVIAEQFKLHLHRGIGYLFANKRITDISSLLIKSSDEVNNDN